MNIWSPNIIREKLGLAAQEMGLRMPQMQSLLAQERFLARLVRVPEGKKYVWKGGSLVLRLYQGLEVPRFTVDVDLLAQGISIEKTAEVFRQSFEIELNDGFNFLSVGSTPMERETPYGGDRFEIAWKMFDKNQSEPLRVDVCAGDRVEAQHVSLASAFIYPEPLDNLTISVYPAEFIFAEKLETIFRFGTGNTRLKDFIDLWGLIQRGVDPTKLQSAIDACFENRKQSKDFVELERIMNDKAFVELLELAKDRNYSNLNLPSMKAIVREIVSYCKDSLSS